MPTAEKPMLTASCSFMPWCLCIGAFCFLAVGPFVPKTLAANETVKLTASDGTADDVFGGSVAISGDTMVVGAPGGDISPSVDQGSAYVFVRIAGTWTPRAKLTASDGTTMSGFGTSVGVYGDTVVVGAHGNMVVPNDPGAAYVFVKPAGGWVGMTQTAKLTAADGADSDFFGISVAVSGDTIVVGAFDDDNMDAFGNNIINQGSAYVFVKPGVGWGDMTQTAKLTSSNSNSTHWLGRSVAVSGDTVIAGVPTENVRVNIGSNGNPNFVTHIDQGSAYVFVKPSGGWSDMTQTARLTAADGAANEWLGYSVAVSEDTVIAGARFDDIGPIVRQGSAYLFAKPGGGWNDMTQTAKLTASDGAYGELFGESVAVSGDTVVVGTSPSKLDEFGEPAPAQGSAYVFFKPGSGWNDMTEMAKLTASDAADEDRLGYSVAVSGDTIVVSAVEDDIDSNVDQGSACVFELTAGPIEQPLAATGPHDRSKNRYISFVPNNGWSPVALQVTKTTAPGGTAWIGVPDANGMARVVNAPMYRIWPETVIHVGDCEIVPSANYEIRSTNDGAAFSSPLTVSTIPVPALNNKLWGDTVGINNGGEWTPPNQFTNVNDVLGILAYISGAAIRPHFTVANLQAVSTGDPCLNAFVNTADVLIAVKAIAGDAYPFTTNPANCPVCP